MSEVDEPMESPHLGGGKICCKGAVFSPDGKYLIAAGFGAVRVYSATTGQRVGSLSEKVVSVAVHPEDKSTVYAALPDGWFIAWDILSQRILKKIDTQAHIIDMIIPMNSRCAYMSQKTQDERTKVVELDLQKWSLQGDFLQASATNAILSSDGSGRLIAVAALGEQAVEIFHSQSHKKPLCIHTSKIQKTPVSCIRLSECGNILAVGLESGAIALYHNIKKMVENETRYDTKKPSIVHWHREAVSSLQFCPDGVYLTSAGVEGVLVFWHLETLKPVFVPRVGGEITSVGVNPVGASVYAVCLRRNTVKIINTASHQIKGGVWGVIAPPADVPSGEATEVSQLHPRTGWITLTGDNGVLQFYDIVKDRHIKLLQTLERNAVQYVESRGTVGPRPAEPRVQNMAFSADGSTLVTVGICPSLSAIDGVQSRLTFWSQTTASTEPYEANTVMDEPHKSQVAGVCCSPGDDMVVTTSRSGGFKLWTKQATDKAVSWRCRSVCSYRGESMSGCSFSSDGTVLAVACTSCVALWDPITLKRLGLLSFPVDLDSAHAVSQLEFVHGTDFLVGCSPTAPFLVVWDLLRLVIHWAIPLRVDQLTADPVLHKFAVVIRCQESAEWDKKHDDVVAVFSPEDSTPVNVYRQPGRTVSCLRFAPMASPMQAAHSSDGGEMATHSPLVIVFDSRQFYVETGSGRGVLLAEDAESPRSTPKTCPSALQLAFGPSSNPTSMQTTFGRPVAPLMEERNYFKDLKDVPSHRLPPVNLMCSDFFDTLLSKKRKLEQIGESRTHG